MSKLLRIQNQFFRSNLAHWARDRFKGRNDILSELKNRTGAFRTLSNILSNIELFAKIVNG